MNTILNGQKRNADGGNGGTSNSSKSPRCVEHKIARYAKKVGIANNVNPHTLRHSFATDLYRETSKIRLLQKVLGHSDLSTTMIYTHIHDPEVEEALKSFRQATAVAV